MSSENDHNGSGHAEEPVDHRVTVDLEFATLREFREEMAPYLNHRGLFIKTDRPYRRGTAVRVRFVMPEDFVLAQATGVVASTRTAEKDPELEPGMVVWFEEVDGQSRAVIRELVDFHIAVGGAPFDIGLDTDGAGEIPTDALGGTAPPPPEPSPQESASQEAEASPAPQPSDEVLPEWLSKVANEHDIDLSLDLGSQGGQPEISRSEHAEPTGQDFEVAMIDDIGEPESTPVRVADEGVSDPTIVPSDRRKPPRDLRLWPLVGAATVLVAISIGVWWLVMKPASPQISESHAVPQPTVPAPSPSAVVEEAEQQSSAKAQDVLAPLQKAPAGVVPATGPATRIVDVAVKRVGDATVIDIRGNGGLSEDRLRVSLLADPPRVWLRIRGIETFFKPNEIAIGSPELTRIRVGHHPEDTPVSLWVVLDLADGSMVVRDTVVSGNTIRVSVGRR
jgi:Tfp pilus assembly protein PilZ